MRVLKAGWDKMKGGIDHTPGPCGGAVAGEMAKETPGLMSVTAAALIVVSKLSVTSHLSNLAEEEPEVAVCVNSLVAGCKSL